jgi:ADP-heptose:LPS heptosyltransferase
MVEAVGPSGRQGNDRAPADGARAAHGAGRPAGSPGNGLRSGINRLDGNRPVPGPYICVNVNAGNVYLERRWPRERFSEAVGILAGSHPEVTFVFTGTAAERSYTQGAIPAHLSGRCVNAAGDYSIRKLASLFAGAELVISCDSGPLHLADMLGVPCIGIYGPETPTFYGVTGEASVRLYKPVSCSPCMNLYDARSFRCPYNARCMDEIAPGDLVEAVETLTALSGEPQAHTPVGSLQALTPGI